MASWSLCVRAFAAPILFGALIALSSPALAQETPPPGGNVVDRLAPIRDQVKSLEAAGEFERALGLVRAVKEESLTEVAQKLERAQWIDRLTGAQLARYTLDRKRAGDLERDGKLAEAAAALESVEVYGTEEQRKEAHGDRVRLRAAAVKAEADAKAQSADAAKKRAQDLEKDAKEARQKIEGWLKDRKSLACSKCKGEKLITCKACEGSGKREVIAADWKPGFGGSPKRLVPCEKCAQSGKVTCTPDNCGGLGFARYKLREVLWDIWTPSFQDKLDFAVGSRDRFVDLMVQRESTQTKNEAAVEIMYRAIGSALRPIRKYEKIEIASGEDGIFTAKYRVGLGGGEDRWEETRWRKEGSAWGIVPPALPEAKK
jgi:hypothetical protein